MIERIELDQIDLKKRLLLILLQLLEWRLLQKSKKSGNAGKARQSIKKPIQSLSRSICRLCSFRLRAGLHTWLNFRIQSILPNNTCELELRGS